MNRQRLAQYLQLNNLADLRQRLTQLILSFTTFGTFLILLNGLLEPEVEGLTVTLVLLAIVVAMTYFVSRGLYVGLVANAFAILFLVTELIYGSNIFTTYLSLITPVLVVAALIAHNLIFALSVVLIVAQGFWLSTTPQVTDSSVIIAMIFAVIISVAVRFILNQLENFSRRSVRANELLSASADVGRLLTQDLQLESLFPNAVNLIRERFGYYHVQVFSIDETRNYANLVASTGEAGQQLLSRNHRIVLGSTSIVGRATQLGRTIISQDTMTDEFHAPNDLLPKTRAEVAFPIFEGNRVVGALDVQSEKPFDFSDFALQGLNVIASQLGTAVANARLYTRQQDALQENKRLYEEADANLQEIQRLNQRLTQQAWRDYLTHDLFINGVTLAEQEFVPRAEWTDSMEEVATVLKTVTQTLPDKQVITVPIKLRQELLGVFELEFDPTQHLQDLPDVLDTVAQRLAIALENARLVEETQATTAQELQINEVSSQLQAASSVEELMQITLQELYDLLGAEAGKIRLGAVSSSSPQPERNGDVHL